MLRMALLFFITSLIAGRWALPASPVPPQALPKYCFSCSWRYS